MAGKVVSATFNNGSTSHAFSKLIFNFNCLKNNYFLNNKSLNALKTVNFIS